MTIDHPLRLAVGSHRAGTGKGCVMNVIAWENGDSEITDMPGCADPMLALVAQKVNDSICTHRDGDLLCPECSTAVLDLGHRIAGTTSHALADEELHRVWVTIAMEEAERVLPIFEAAVPGDDRPREAVEATRSWLAGGPRPAAAAAAANATANAVDLAYAAYANAANATANAANAAAVLTAAHSVVDRFRDLVPLTEWEPVIDLPTAIEKMTASTALA